MNLTNILASLSLVGMLNCKNPIESTPMPETPAEIKTGDISGRVLWDINKDGVYEPSSYALITLGGDYAIIGGDGRNPSWFRCNPNSMCTTADSAGYFQLKDVTEGMRGIYFLNFPDPKVIDIIYGLDKKVEVKPNEINSLGDVRMDVTGIIK